MSKSPSIPHALQIEVVRDPPRKILHVTTLLPLNPSTPGFDAVRRDEMLKAIAELVGPRCEFSTASRIIRLPQARIAAASAKIAAEEARQ